MSPAVSLNKFERGARSAGLAALISFHYTGKPKYQSSNTSDGKHLSIVLVFLKVKLAIWYRNFISNFSRRAISVIK